MQPIEQQLKDYYSRDLGRRVSSAMRAKAGRGILPGCAPLGYKNAVVDGERAIVIDPNTAPKVKRLFELAARKKMSLRKLASEAEKMGLRSRNGKPFGPSSLKAILDNPFYEGTIRYQGDLIKGNHEPLTGDSMYITAAH